jgi:hypothetical protein
MKKLVPLLLAFLIVGVAGAAPSVVSTTETSATVEGLDCGSKYRLAIRKYNADGSLNSSTSYVYPQTKACPDTQPPSAPQALAATGATQTSISVSWSASTDNVGVAGYTLYRGGVKVGSTGATSYTFGGLSCGTNYTLAVEAHDAKGNRSAASQITASSTACPPPSCPTGAYVTQYHGNTTLSGTPVLQRCESAINYDWGSGSPGANVPSDRFSTRWTGTFSFAAGSHQFTATADDGIRIWVDGTPLIDSWKDQAPTTYQAARILTAGEHVVKVEYYENGGGAVARLSWQASQLPVPPPPPPPPPSGDEPGPIGGQGYTVAFEDQFNAIDRTVWNDRIWYEGAPAANAQYVQNGILHLVSRRSQGYQKTTMTTLGSRSFQLGYFEARMKWTKGPGSWPAFWLLSTGWAKTGSCSTPASELDVFEGQGIEPDVFYGTIHRDSANRCTGHVQNSNNWQPTGIDLTAGFHTYAMRWTASEVCWFLDDRQLHCHATYADTNQPMFLLLQMWIGGWMGGTTAATPDELHTEVDWVRVWQK